MIRSRWYGMASAIALIAAAGCDVPGAGAPPVSSSTEEATVSGTVTVKGKAASGGEVQFDPANVHRKVMPRSAPIDKEGRYTIKTLVGENKVSVRGPAVDKDLALAAAVQEVIVQPGENNIPIEVPPPAKAP